MKLCKKCNSDISQRRSDAVFCSKKCKKDHWHRQRYPVPAKRLTEKERKIAIKERKALWLSKNIEKHRLNMRAYCNNRYHNDVRYRLSINLRNRLNEAIASAYKSGSAVQDLGCSIFKLKIHLQLKFHRNPRGKHEYMTWNNYGKNGWHIDHIKPLAKFNLSDPEQLKIACHYTNLQPMWAKDNIKKGARTP